MTHGKSISLFLIDGTTNGVIACELFNWTGKGYKIPRNQLKTMSERDDLKKAGVYFLIGHDPETDQPMVYIGEAEEVFKRILQHQETDFWTEVIDRHHLQRRKPEQSARQIPRVHAVPNRNPSRPVRDAQQEHTEQTGDQ